MSSESTRTVDRQARTGFTTTSGCRGCSGGRLAEILDLGHQPLANGLLRQADEESRTYPLRLAFCEDCSLVQIRETVDKEILFGSYFWVTGTSATARAFAEQFYVGTQRVRPLAPGEIVLEIASNDGTFLRPFLERGHRAVGVDPATNIAAMASARGIPTINDYWDPGLARLVLAENRPAAIVFARNVVPHVSALLDVIQGIELVLAEDGVGAIEFHDASKILRELQYDSIYHEHLSYFSIRSIERLLLRFGLHLFHVDPSPISGGALIVYFSKAPRPVTASLSSHRRREEDLGLDRLEAWREFAEACHRHRDRSRAILEGFAGRRVVGFGASARSSTYLNFCGFGAEDIAAIIDNNPLKHGHFTAGSRIPIVTMEDGLAMDPELLFVLAWNFRDEVLESCRKRNFRGTFLVPFPNQPRLVEERGAP